MSMLTDEDKKTADLWLSNIARYLKTNAQLNKVTLTIERNKKIVIHEYIKNTTVEEIEQNGNR